MTSFDRLAVSRSVNKGHVSSLRSADKQNFMTCTSNDIYFYSIFT
jgi:hypothetical protein